MSKKSDDCLCRSDILARERTLLANERTMLAYMRTAFAAFLFGIAMIRFFDGGGLLFYTGLFSVAIGFLFLIFGIVYFPFRNRRIRSQ